MTAHRGGRTTRTVVCVLVVLALVAGTTLSAQESDSLAIDGAQPYEEDEFAEWARDLRRAEIVATGTLPLTILASRLLYGLGRFAIESIGAGAILPQYLPPLFAPPGYQPLTREDNLWIVAGAVSLSSVVAVIDYVLGRHMLSEHESAGETLPHE